MAGRLDDLADLASKPSEKMDGKLPGMLARQVGVDRDRNTVVVWVTFSDRSDLDDCLATEEGKDDHGEDHDMTDIIDTFEMYDLTPVSGRLATTRQRRLRFVRLAHAVRHVRSGRPARD